MIDPLSEAPTTVARLTCDETTARRIASIAHESLDGEDVVCSLYEDGDGAWEVALHFRAPPDESALRRLVAFAAGDAVAHRLRFEQLEGLDWVAQSLAGLSPVVAGRFLVHGAHDRASVPVNALAIEIEAALAFGTGHHGTTRGCLLALDELAKRRRKRRVLDLGTGSGILAMAAVKRTHRPVVASDTDLQSVTAARANARRNGMAGLVTFVHATGTKARTITQAAPYDLIFANILLGPLMRLARPIRRLASRGAHVVLSGLLPAQANAALAVYRAQGLILERRIALEGWVTLVLRRP